MSVARWVESVFVGRDQRKEKDLLIAEQKGIARNNIQAVQSGARLVQHMSGMIQMIAEHNHAK